MSDGFDGCAFCHKQALLVEEFREKIRQLEDQLYGREWDAPLEFNLSACQEAILRALATRDRVCSIGFLIDSTRGLKNTRMDYPDDECIRTQISHMRKKVTPFGIEIQTVHARGYRLSDESRNRLLNWPATTQAAA